MKGFFIAGGHFQFWWQVKFFVMLDSDLVEFSWQGQKFGTFGMSCFWASRILGNIGVSLPGSDNIW